MVAQMMLGPAPYIAVGALSPWVDLRVLPKDVQNPVIEAQLHRLVLKTHLPFDALVYAPKAKYFFGRDGRDVLWSMYHHHVNANDLWRQALNDAPGRVAPPIEPRD